MRPITLGRVVAGALLFGVLLRIYGLGSESIWTDEGASIRIANLDIAQVIEASSVDLTPPLYYLSLHFWIGFIGDSSEVSVRLLSVVCGSLALLVMYRVGALLFSRTTGLLAALILALSAFHVQYSQEARAYVFMVLLTLLSFYFFIKLLGGRSAAASVGYVLCSGLLLYTHVYAFFVIAAQNVYALTSLALPNKFEGNRINLKEWLLLQGTLVVLVAPWLAVLRRQILDTQQRGWIPEPTLGTIYDIFVEFAGSLPLLAFFALLTALSTLSLSVPSRFAGPSAEQNHGAETSKLYLLSLWLLLPILLPFVISRITAPMLLDRYTIAASLALYLLVARGLENVAGIFPRPVVGRMVGFTLVIGVAALSMASTYVYLNEVNKPQWREAASYVDANAESGDLVVVSPGYELETAFDYYSGRGDLEKAPFLTEAQSITEEDLRALEEITAGHDRVWFVFDRFGMGEGTEETIKRELEGSYALADQEQPEFIDVMLWSAR